MAEKVSAKSPSRLRFHYLKSNLFRVVHVDGVLGGWTGPGLLHIATYSERPAIPTVTEHDLIEDQQQLGPADLVEGKTGFVRELDIDLMMNFERAVEMRDWLTQRIDEFKALQDDEESQ